MRSCVSSLEKNIEEFDLPLANESSGVDDSEVLVEESRGSGVRGVGLDVVFEGVDVG